MATCSETKSGEVYTCERCGWTIKVLSACSCGCKDDQTCCGVPMTLKESAEDSDA